MHPCVTGLATLVLFCSNARQKKKSLPMAQVVRSPIVLSCFGLERFFISLCMYFMCLFLLSFLHPPVFDVGSSRLSRDTHSVLVSVLFLLSGTILSSGRGRGRCQAQESLGRVHDSSTGGGVSRGVLFRQGEYAPRAHQFQLRDTT